jgi:hypothetical protein
VPKGLPWFLHASDCYSLASAEAGRQLAWCPNTRQTQRKSRVYRGAVILNVDSASFRERRAGQS